MESSANTFKNAIDKAFTSQPNVKINATTMGDALKYKSSFTEEKTEDISKDNQKEMVDGKEEIFCVVHLYVFDTVELENLLGRFREDVRKFNKKNNTFEKILTFKNQ